MSALSTTQRRRRRTRDAADCDRGGDGPRREEQTPTLFGEAEREPTLDALVTGAWETLANDARARCPVCGGEMAAGYGAHARPTHGRCGDCGTTLS